MSLSALLAQAAKQAQAVLAPLADPNTDGEFIISGTTYDGILNLREIEMGVGPNGLIRVEELTIEATAEQWTTAPSAAPRFRLTAYGRQWYCNKVKTVGVFYHFTCVPA